MTQSYDEWIASISPEQALAGMRSIEGQLDLLQRTCDALAQRIGEITVGVALGEIGVDQGTELTADYLQLAKKYREELNVHMEADWRLFAIWSGVSTT